MLQRVYLKMFIKDAKNIWNLNTIFWVIYLCLKNIKFYLKHTIISKLKKYPPKVVLIYHKDEHWRYFCLDMWMSHILVVWNIHGLFHGLKIGKRYSWQKLKDLWFRNKIKLFLQKFFNSSFFKCWASKWDQHASGRFRKP